MSHITPYPMENKSNPVYKDQRFGQYREMLYDYDQDGKFVKNVGYHAEPDRVSLQQTWDFFNERIEEARQKVLAGLTSPITFYMEKNLVTPLDLSMHAGIGVWRVKRHLKPRVFAKLSEKTLKKYAEAFNITVEQLKNIELSNRN